MKKRLTVYFKTPEDLMHLKEFAKNRGFSSTSGYLKWLYAMDKQKANI